MDKLIKEKSMIQVKTISSKMAKQVPVVAWTTELYRRLFKCVQNKTIKPVGWVAGKALDLDGWKLLLVDYADNGVKQYGFLLIDSGQREEMLRGVEQLFIS